MKRRRLLVVDDEPHMIWLLRESLSEEFDVAGATNGKEALQTLSGTEQVHLVVLDLRLKRENGIDVLKKLKRVSPAVPVLIITAYASVSTAVEAIKTGAYDYITKPFDIEELRILIRRALTESGVPEAEPGLTAADLAVNPAQEMRNNNIVARSRPMLDIWRLVQRVAPTEATVLITGESGTGKELIARALHSESPRCKNPFIAINCAALPENLLESELFGYDEGAFTGARGRKPGKFELAGGGTILLDEIGEMQLSTQAKILRVLEEKAVDRLGSTGSTPVDVRIIASTNKDLSCLVRKGEFREDLYFRLAVFPIAIPPLRERQGDIELLAEHFLHTFARKYKKEVISGFDGAVTEMMFRYNWPGNVRELRNTLEQLVILSDGPLIMPGDIPPSFGVLSSLVTSPAGAGPSAGRFRECKGAAEKQAVSDALRECSGNRTRAAELLGISRRSLQLKINKFKLQ